MKKKEREELIQPDLPTTIYTSDTSRAVTMELRRGGDPYKIARYFGVSIDSVLKAKRRLGIVASLLEKEKK
jgi:hypothetical protein